VSAVVSDTSPLRALHHLGEIWILQRLYARILVPPAVAAELAFPRGKAGPVDVSGISFITVQSPTDQQRVSTLLKMLDRGEAEAIALATEVKAVALLIDEAAGRAVAAASGIPHIGLVGILGRAKQEKLITEVRSRIDRLKREISFYVSDQFYAQFLKSIGE
jgi:predicted nucleic acid-binding protein